MIRGVLGDSLKKKGQIVGLRLKKDTGKERVVEKKSSRAKKTLVFLVWGGVGGGVWFQEKKITWGGFFLGGVHPREKGTAQKLGAREGEGWTKKMEGR